MDSKVAGEGLVVQLDGAYGSLWVAVSGDAFEIVGGSGDYLDAQGSGSVKATIKYWPWRRHQGNEVTGTERLTLDLRGLTG